MKIPFSDKIIGIFPDTVIWLIFIIIIVLLFMIWSPKTRLNKINIGNCHHLNIINNKILIK
jgi:type IV secretory pathway TrbL component